jgi:hypothetical protein
MNLKKRRQRRRRNKNRRKEERNWTACDTEMLRATSVLLQCYYSVTSVSDALEYFPPIGSGFPKFCMHFFGSL